MSKTVMHELIDMYKKDIETIKKDYMNTKSIVILRELSTLETVVTNLENSLPKEKQQLIDARMTGDLLCDTIKAEQYYNLKFKDNETEPK